jgi:transposase
VAHALAHQVTLLAKRGEARRALGVSRNTVRSLLDAHAAGREDVAQIAVMARPPRAPRPSKLDAWKPRVAALIAKYADITAQRVFERLRAEGFTGGYSGVKKHLRAVRPPPKPTPSLTTPDHGPGEMAESDWSPYEIRFTTGKTAIVQRCRTCSSSASGSTSGSTRATTSTR